MSLYKIIHYIFGEYVYETDLSSFLRLSSRLTQKRLHFWGSEPVAEDLVRFRLSVFAAEEVNKLSKQNSIPLTEVSKKGIPFIFSRYRRRYGLIIGMISSLFLLFYSQLYVWDIEISGNSNLPDSVIEEALLDIGIELGSFIPYIDVQNEANDLLINCRELSSVAISIRGTYLTVNVLERVEPPEIVDTKGFYNVVASRDGIIIDIDASEGTPEVAVGDAVYEGELLINSFIEGTNGTFRPTHARGPVFAAVEESFVAKIPLKRNSKHYTGNIRTKKRHYILGWELPSLFSDESPYEFFDAVASERELELFGFIKLPIRQFRVVYSEYEVYETPIDTAYAERLALESLDDFLAEFDCEVLSCENEFVADEKNGVCVLSAKAVLRMNIAKEVKLEIFNNQTISERFPSARE